jgi:hypothetical protein
MGVNHINREPFFCWFASKMEYIVRSFHAWSTLKGAHNERGNSGST